MFVDMTGSTITVVMLTEVSKLSVGRVIFGGAGVGVGDGVGDGVAVGEGEGVGGAVGVAVGPGVGVGPVIVSRPFVCGSAEMAFRSASMNSKSFPLPTGAQVKAVL